MLDFVLSKMTWLITSVLVLSFIIGFYNVQNDAVDDDLLFNTGEEINRVIKSLDAMEGESVVNFTFDGYNSYRAIYLPGSIGGEVYRMTFYSSFVQMKLGNTDVGLHYGTEVQPLLGNTTDEPLDDLLAAPDATYVNRIHVYSTQDFSVASRSLDGGLTYTLFVYLSTETVYYAPGDEDGFELLYGDSEEPGIASTTHEPQTVEVDENGKIPDVTLNTLVTGDHVNRVTCGILRPSGDRTTTILQRDWTDTGEVPDYFASLAPEFIGQYSCELWAEDVFGRRAVGWHNFTIVDGIAPTLASLSVEPASQNHTLPVFINFTALDNYELAGVSITLTRPDGTIFATPAVPGAGGLCQYVYDELGKMVGQYSFTITAVDSSGNLASAVSGAFSLT